MKNGFHSPLRYPGGKRKFAPFIKQLLKSSGLQGVRYIEPYAGGAGVALALLLDGIVSEVVINDFDRSIYEFWRAVVEEPRRLCDAIEEVDITTDTWERQKEVQRYNRNADSFELGFSTFFLNRTNFSGVLLGGIIGGKDQTGQNKLDARFNKDTLISRIQSIAEHRDRITVKNTDAKNLLEEYDATDNFVYLDPPYVGKGPNLYMNSYQEDDHRVIADLLLHGTPKFKWVLSYDDHELIEKLYGEHHPQFTTGMSYGTTHKAARERVFLDPRLDYEEAMPLLKNAACVNPVSTPSP